MERVPYSTPTLPGIITRTLALTLTLTQNANVLVVNKNIWNIVRSLEIPTHWYIIINVENIFER
jgi:hypothetical protein